MILTVGNTKGGVGKTTLSVNIAAARAMEGRKVWLVDGDRQGTAQTAISIRYESGIEPGIACSTYPDGPTLRSQVKQQQAHFDDIIIDVGGRDSTSLRAALSLTDTLLVPFQPQSFDVWALEDIAELVDEARSVRDDLRALVMLNCAFAGFQPADNNAAEKAASDLSQFEILHSQIKRRKAFSNAAGSGQCVFETKPADRKAQKELRALLSILF